MSKIIQILQKIKNYAVAHKIIASVAGVAVVVVGFYTYSALFSSGAQAKYVLATVEKGTLVSTVSGTGQVSASDELDIKPKVSGDVVAVLIKAGQEVKAGQVLAYLDSQTAQRALRDAQLNLETAQINLEKLRRNQQIGSTTDQDDLDQAYRNALNKVTDAFLSLPNLLETARAILYDNTSQATCSPNTCAYSNLISRDRVSEFEVMIDRAESDYTVAKNAYDPNFSDYQEIRLDATPEQITDILTETENTAELLAQAIKSERNVLDTLVSDINDQAAKLARTAQIPSFISSYQSQVSSAISGINTIISNLSASRRTIETTTQSIDDSKLTDPLDLVSQENTVKQRQATLDDARTNLANYTIRASFDGVISKLNIKKGDAVSGSTAIASLLTKQTIAEISLNEVDYSALKIDQKSTMTFDAIEGLTVTGQVLDMDLAGTVNQGVVTYNIKISLDAQDDRIKPGMSVSADIITDAKPDILMVPNASVKTSGNEKYVLVPQDAQGLSATGSSGVALSQTPNQQIVQVGISNDTNTEITSGLKEGDIIIVRTVTSTSASTTGSTQNRGAMQMMGGGR